MKYNGDIMRITGVVEVNGVRVPLDWTINGISVVAGPGLSADHVKVHTSLPALEKAVAGEPAPVEEITTSRWDSLTVTELRVELQNRGLPVYGKKSDLIARLLEYADAEPEEEEVEEVVEEEVVDDVEE